MVKFLDKTGEEITLDALTEEFKLINAIAEALGAEVRTGPLDYEVQQYIQRCLENGTLEMEVWD